MYYTSMRSVYDQTLGVDKYDLPTTITSSSPTPDRSLYLWLVIVLLFVSIVSLLVVCCCEYKRYHDKSTYYVERVRATYSPSPTEFARGVKLCSTRYEETPIHDFKPIILDSFG